ncbi:glycosyltransferase family 2 protein [candidate division KSB1 bacterium]|nr:glycosyltransferase family 2 protein [candidate division KSB1 bacterium]
MNSRVTNIALKTPKVSIGMPVFNGAKFIDEALQSFLVQTFEDFELIISDNASSDSTESICREYARRDKRIKYYRQETNKGAIWNFNHVFKLARGKYFKWAAYDDICKPTFLARCIDVLDKDPSVLWCHTKSGKTDASGKEILRWKIGQNNELPRNNYNSPSPHRRFKGVLLGTNWCVDSYAVFRVDALKSTRMLLPCYGAEKVLLGEMSLRGCYKEVPEKLFYQRHHLDAASSLNSSVKQQRYMNPKNTNHFAFTRFKLLFGHVISIIRTDLTTAEKILCFFVIFQYLLQFKKWRKIIIKTIFGSGLAEDLSILHTTCKDSQEWNSFTLQKSKQEPITIKT